MLVLWDHQGIFQSATAKFPRVIPCCEQEFGWETPGPNTWGQLINFHKSTSTACRFASSRTITEDKINTHFLLVLVGVWKDPPCTEDYRYGGTTQIPLRRKKARNALKPSNKMDVFTPMIGSFFDSNQSLLHLSPLFESIPSATKKL